MARRVSELMIEDVPIVRRRTTRRPAVSSDNLISQIDRVSCSIAECIQLGENALRCPGDTGCMPFGLRNNSEVYSDLLQVPRKNPPAPDLTRSDSDQIGSDSAPEPNLEYQVATGPTDQGYHPQGR